MSTTMSTPTANAVHEYFTRSFSDWGIIDFLFECNLQEFSQMIDTYLKSLELIYANDKEKKGERAKQLLDRYRQAIFLASHKGDKPDYYAARNWKSVHKLPTLQFHKPTFASTLIGNVGTESISGDIHFNFPSNATSTSKRSQEEVDNKVPKKVRIDDYFLVHDDTTPSQHKQNQQPDPENQTRTTRETSPPSINSMHSVYVPSPSDSSINEEECIKAGKKTYRLSYFTGPGVLEWHLNEHSIRWIVSDVDISEICLEYRAEVIKKCEPMAVILDASEELHIFVFQEESPCGLCEYFDDELWEDIFNEFQKLYPYVSIPNTIYDLFANIIKITCETQNRGERQAVARSFLKGYEIITEEERIMVEIFKDLKIAIEGANKMSESSAIANRSFDPILLGMKPDFTVKTTNPKQHIELLIGEVKPPNTRDELISEDLVALGKMMKCAIDKSIADGFLGRAYFMDLLYDGIYRMILIGEFELPKSSISWGTVLKCYQIMNTIRVIVNNGATRYQSAIRKNSKQPESDKMKMIKPMFHDPLK
ncbi:4239_t:CDS:10, partial [Diversispora eburnea]